MKIKDLLKKASKWPQKEIDKMDAATVERNIEVLKHYATNTDCSSADVRLIRLLKSLGFE